MASRDVVRALAFGRIALGVALLLRPRVASVWVGPVGASSGVSVLARALGIRDALLGGMLLHVLDNPQVARRWVTACGVCDVVDGAAAAAVRDDLPPVRGRLGALFALGAGVAHLALSDRVGR
jgi:hypothetical protein